MILRPPNANREEEEEAELGEKRTPADSGKKKEERRGNHWQGKGRKEEKTYPAGVE